MSAAAPPPARPALAWGELAARPALWRELAHWLGLGAVFVALACQLAEQRQLTADCRAALDALRVLPPAPPPERPAPAPVPPRADDARPWPPAWGTSDTLRLPQAKPPAPARPDDAGRPAGKRGGD